MSKFMEWYRPAADELSSCLLVTGHEPNYEALNAGCRFVSPQVGFQMWSPLDAAYHWENYCLSDPDLTDATVYEAVEWIEEAVCRMDEHGFSNLRFKINKHWWLEDLQLLDAAYGMMVQKAAQHNSRPHGVDLPKLVVEATDDESQDLLNRIISGRQCMGFVCTEGFELVTSNTMWAQLLSDRTDVSIFHFLRQLNLLYPCASLDLLVQTESGPKVDQALLNEDHGYSGARGWHRLTSCLVVSNLQPDGWGLRVDDFSKAKSLLEEWFSFVRPLLNPDVVPEIESVLYLNQTFT